MGKGGIRERRKERQGREERWNREGGLGGNGAEERRGKGKGTRFGKEEEEDWGREEVVKEKVMAFWEEWEGQGEEQKKKGRWKDRRGDRQGKAVANGKEGIEGDVKGLRRR